MQRILFLTTTILVLNSCSLFNEGCTENSACNYDDDAVLNDGSCEYPDDCYDCDSSCVCDIDCAGECGGTLVEDCAGECGGDNKEDCLGVCGGSALIDDCGVCDGIDVINDGYCQDDIDFLEDLISNSLSTINMQIDFNDNGIIEPLELVMPAYEINWIVEPWNNGKLQILSCLNEVADTLQSFNLSGNIPESIGNCNNLVLLNLGGNKLSGNIPES